jgi:hypothetical protein
MVDDVPDETLFQATLGDMVGRARGGGRRLRAFGEMVGVLWSEGNKDGALKLEHLWTRLQAEQKFPLFCAYSRADLRPNSIESDVQTICAAHSRVVPGYL